MTKRTAPKRFYQLRLAIPEREDQILPRGWRGWPTRVISGDESAPATNPDDRAPSPDQDDKKP